VCWQSLVKATEITNRHWTPHCNPASSCLVV